jgi:hypothetical protein
VTVLTKPKFPRRRDGMYRPEPELLAAIRALIPHAPAEYDSVTTAMKQGVPAPELDYWKIGEAARRPIEDPWTFDTVEKVRRDMDASLEAAADRGKTIHSWIEAYAKGATLGVSSVPDQFQGYAKAFSDWAATVSWKHIVFTEANVYSTKHGYAGTADVALRDPLGLVTLYDFKTNKQARVYRSTGLQLRAYEQCDLIVLGGGVQLMPAIDSMRAIGLGPDGNWTPRSFSEDMGDFLAALRMYRWKKRGDR